MDPAPAVNNLRIIRLKGKWFETKPWAQLIPNGRDK